MSGPTVQQKMGDLMVEAVIENKRNVLTQNASSVNAISEEGYTPLYTACMKAGVHVETLQLLLKLGATVDLKGTDRETPLYIAAHNNNIPFVKLLLQAGAQINEENGPEQETCLHLAAKFGYVEMLLFLLQSGANVNVRNSRMETPLFAAAKLGKHETVFQLLLHNANPNFSNEDGKNALYIASEKGHKHVVIVLKAEPKYLKEAKAEADVELKMRRPSLPTSEELVDTAQRRKQKEQEEEKALAALKPKDAAPGKKPAAKAAAAPPPKAAPVQKMEIIPIEIPKMVIRDHDPITGESRGPCRSLEEVGYDEPPPIPKGMVLKPVVHARVGGTSMKVGTGTEIEGAKVRQLDMIPDEAVDYEGVVLPKQK